MAGIVLALCFFSGCSSAGHAPGQASTPQPQAGAAPTVAVKPIPFAELLQSLPRFSQEETGAYLRAVVFSPAESDTNKQEAAYMLARSLQKQGGAGDLQEAISLFEQAGKQAPLWERSQWHISECATGLGQETSVRNALEAIREKTSNPQSKAAVDYALAQSYLRANETDKAKEAFQTIRRDFPDSQYALGSAYYLAEELVDTPEGRDRAIELFREYLKNSPDGHFARDVVNRMSALPDFKPTAADSDRFGQVHYLHGEWDQALTDWAGTKGDKHWYERATCLLRLGRTNEAKQAYQMGIVSHPDDPAVPEAARLLCTYLTREQAAALWQSILDRSTKFGDNALWNLALRSSPPTALTYYDRLVRSYPTSEYAPESSWWLFWNQVKKGNSAAAIARGRIGIKRYPTSRAAPRMAFWIGKLQERLKQKEAARAAYKLAAEKFASDYYGYRAKGRLAALSGGRDRGWSTQPARKHPAPDWAWPDPPYLASWQDIFTGYGATEETLARLGQWDECLQLLPPDADPTLRAWITAKLDLPLDAINTMTRSLEGRPARAGRWEMAYPLLHGQDVAREAATRKVDPMLVHALIREESRYNPNALSRSNALGLMQLLPGTAYGVAKHLGIGLSGRDNIFNPPTNISLGTAYLASTLARAKGHAMLAVAGYNGGPNAVRGWNSRFQGAGGTDYDIFVEDIPYRETRDYVRKVFGSFWNYEAIYTAARS